MERLVGALLKLDGTAGMRVAPEPSSAGVTFSLGAYQAFFTWRNGQHIVIARPHEPVSLEFYLDVIDGEFRVRTDESPKQWRDATAYVIEAVLELWHKRVER